VTGGEDEVLRGGWSGARDHRAVSVLEGGGEGLGERADDGQREGRIEGEDSAAQLGSGAREIGYDLVNRPLHSTARLTPPIVLAIRPGLSLHIAQRKGSTARCVRRTRPDG
jgi:hypothetical protein